MALNVLTLVPPRSASPAEPRTLSTYAGFLVLALLSWGQAACVQGREAGLSGHLGLGVAAGLMVAGRIVGSAVEAGTYTLWWRARGVRLPCLPFGVALLALSVVDRLALALALVAARAPALGPWLAALAGLHLLGRGWLANEPGLRAAVGSLGLLTLFRVSMTAWLQAAAVRRALGEPLLVTAAVWALTRVALWWTTDLLRGMSPLP